MVGSVMGVDGAMNVLFSLILAVGILLFFFSSRRRHTRWTGDWSSDVCSSDLLDARLRELAPSLYLYDLTGVFTARDVVTIPALSDKSKRYFDNYKIGRASCRERV